ncbi:MAG: hypothetical protein NZ556_09570, partial [Fimbriimonadales bacterium]|nr:hypothetical protein [Fimbriimonadales bacterium]
MQPCWNVGRMSAALLLSVCLCCGAAPDDSLGRDDRLNQRLTLREAGAPLNRLFQKISKQTGVALQPDAMLAELRMVLYAPDRPLREVMRHLAVAFGAEWRADDNQPPAYTLHALPVEKRARPAQERIQTVKRLLRELYAPSWLLPDESTDPIDDTARPAYKQAEAQRRAPLQFLKHLTEAEINALGEGKTLEFSSRTDARFKPEWLAAWKTRLKDELPYLAEMLSTPKGDMELAEYYGEIHDTALDAGDEVRLRIVFDPDAGALECAVGLFAAGALVYGETHFEEDEGQRVAGYEDADGNPILPSQHPWAQVALPKPSEADSPDAVHTRLHSLPPLEGDWFSHSAEFLLRVAQAAGKPFVAEFYDTLAQYRYPNTTASFARELAFAGYEWLQQGEWTIMRHTDRARVRARDIPSRALERWFFQPRRRGVLTLQSLVEMGDYADPHLGYALFLYLAQLGGEYGLVYEGEPPSPYVIDSKLTAIPTVHHGLLYALRSLEPIEHRSTVFEAFASLSAGQRRALAGGQAVPLSALSAQARKAVYTLWGVGDAARVPAFWSDAPPQGALRLVSRAEPVHLYRLPVNKAREVKDIETAKRLWDELYEQEGDHERFV